MIGDDVLADAAALLSRLREAGLTVATAESCTGGLVAAALTHHAGSSASVLGGFVTYSNAMKQALLDVPAEALAAHGAVSAPVAAAMAEGAKRRSGADLAVSITGIAGPGGATPGKPVGLVWFGLKTRNDAARTLSRIFPGDRAAVRGAAVRQALALLQEGAASLG